VADLVGASADEVIFTSGGSESNGMVLRTFAGQSLAVSSIEHLSILETAKALQPATKVEFIQVGPDARLDFESLAKILKRRPALVSVMLANNETGTLQDVKKIAKLAHEAGAFVHSDAAQALGKVPVDVLDLGVDYMTLSAHKIGGPIGVGALYVKAGAPIKPLILGGHQEGGLRAGTYNVDGIVAFGQAAKKAKGTPQKYKTKVWPLQKALSQQIESQISGVRVNGCKKHTLPNTLNVSFAAAEGESIMLLLDAVGIAVSTGSACAADSLEPSHVLMAMQADPELAHGSIRFSLGLDNTMADVDYVMQHLPKVISKLRSFSTIGGSR
jgi:cysteine desulfurase